jgi:hypothetical protein
MSQRFRLVGRALCRTQATGASEPEVDPNSRPRPPASISKPRFASARRSGQSTRDAGIGWRLAKKEAAPLNPFNGAAGNQPPL